MERRREVLRHCSLERRIEGGNEEEEDEEGIKA